MFWFFFVLSFLTIVIAWVYGEALSSLGRWSAPGSELAKDMYPTRNRDEFDFGALVLVCALVLSFLLVPSAVTTNGQSISLHEVSDSMRGSRDVGTVNVFVGAWRAEDPLKFWAFFAGLPVTLIWLFRRSPGLLGVAIVAVLLVFWLRMNPGISTLSF
jgi:hypothetical protein